MFTSRFLNSVEKASAVVAAAATAANNAINNVDSTSSSFDINPIIVLDGEVTGESDYGRENTNSFSSRSHQYQRRELSWWSVALQFGEFSNSFEVFPPACPSVDCSFSFVSSRHSFLSSFVPLLLHNISFLAVHPPCPPHDKPQPPHCQHHHHKSSGGSSHSSSSSGGGSWGSDAWGGDEWGGDEWGGDEWGE